MKRFKFCGQKPDVYTLKSILLLYQYIGIIFHFAICKIVKLPRPIDIKDN